MARLFGLHDELPEDIGDLVIEDNIPVGPVDDEETATADEEDEE